MKLVIELKSVLCREGEPSEYKHYGIYFNDSYAIGFSNRLPLVTGLEKYIFCGFVRASYTLRILWFMVSSKKQFWTIHEKNL